MDDPIVATVVVPLLHIPPLVASLNAVVPVPHIVSVPVIADTAGLTVTTCVIIHPYPEV